MEIEIVEEYDPDREISVAQIRFRGARTLDIPAGVYLDGGEAIIEIYLGDGGVEWTIPLADLTSAIASAVERLNN